MILSRSEVEDIKTAPMQAKADDVERLSNTAIYWSEMAQRFAKVLDAHLLAGEPHENDN